MEYKHEKEGEKKGCQKSDYLKKELIKAINDINETITDNDMQAEVVRELQAIRQELKGINKSLQVMGDFFDDLKPGNHWTVCGITCNKRNRRGNE